MKYLHTYSQYDIQVLMNRDVESELYEAIIESGYFSLINEEVKIKDWFQEKGKKAKEAIKKGSDKAKHAGVQFIAKLGEDFMKIIKAFVKVITGFIKKMIELAKKLVGKTKDKNAVKKAIEGLKESELKTGVDEVKYMRQMAKHCFSYFTGEFGQQVGKVMGKAGSQEVALESVTTQSMYSVFTELIKEDASAFFDDFEDLKMLCESEEPDEQVVQSEVASKVPILSKIREKLNKVPPFVWLEDIYAKVKSKTNTKFEAVSNFVANKAKGPGPYKFLVVGMLAGSLAFKASKEGIGWVVKKAGVGAASAGLMVAIPMAGILWNVIYWTVEGLWYVELMEMFGVDAYKAIKAKVSKG